MDGTREGQRLGWLRWIDRLSATLAILAGAAALAMMTNIVADVAGRVFFRPLPGTVDITQFAWMPIVVSLGMGYALLVGQHIRIGLLTDRGSPLMQRVVEVCAMAATLAMLAAFTWFGAERAFRSTQIGEFSSATPWLPIGVFRWVMVAGLLGLGLQALAQLIRAMVLPDAVTGDDEIALIESQLSSFVAEPSPDEERR